MPGGTITYENRNLFGKAASIGASVTTKNFLSPADDLSFRVQYNHVSMEGESDGLGLNRGVDWEHVAGFGDVQVFRTSVAPVAHRS